jgi:hypothetical protein
MGKKLFTKPKREQRKKSMFGSFYKEEVLSTVPGTMLHL